MAVTYSSLASTTLSTSAASVTLSSISSAYTDLVLVTQHTCASGTNNQLVIRPNSDSSAIYSRTGVTGDGSAPSSFQLTGEQGIFVSYVGNNTDITTSVNHFQNYSSTNINKSIITRSNNYLFPRAQITLWRSTAAISSLYIYPYSGTFAAGSIFTLYGIKAA